MTTTFIHTGDAHIDTDHHGGINPATGIDTAWESNAAALASAVAHAVEHRVDAFVHAGDAFKHGRPSVEAVLLLTETLRPLADEGIPVVLIDGNHERLMVRTGQRTATAVVGQLLSRHGEVHVVEREPRLVTTSTGLQVACLPWLSKATVLTRLDRTDVDPAHGDRIMVEQAMAWLEVMCDSADDTLPLVLASHVTVDDVKMDALAPGARRGSELDIAHVFAEPILPRAMLDASPVSYAALSHIHARQHLGGKCFYSGSPNRLTLTDADDPKSVNLVTVEPGSDPATVRHLDTAARAMHLVDLAGPGASDRIAAMTPGALVGLRLPPGESTPDPVVLAGLEAAGARVIATQVRPVDATGTDEVVTVAERTDPVTALSTWLSTHRPEADTAAATAMATEIVETTGGAA